MMTIEKISNIDGLLSMTNFLEKMKPKSIVVLFAKLCDLGDPDLKKNEKFRDLVTFIQDNWVFGALGV